MKFGHRVQLTVMILCSFTPTLFLNSSSLPSQERGGVEEQPVPQDKMQSLRAQVDGVKDIMTENVDRILARGERLDDLMDKSEDLQAGVSITIRSARSILFS